MRRTVARLLLFPLLALGACSSGQSNVVRKGGPGPAVVGAIENEPLWISQDVPDDLGSRTALMEQLRVQVMQKTRAVPERSRLVVREQLRRKLDRAGFHVEEVTYILSSLDHPRV